MGFSVATGGMHSVIHRQQIHHRIRFRGNWRPPKKFNSNNRIVAATKFSAANEISDNMRAAALPVTSLRRSQKKKKKAQVIRIRSASETKLDAPQMMKVDRRWELLAARRPFRLLLFLFCSVVHLCVNFCSRPYIYLPFSLSGTTIFSPQKNV